MDLTAEAVEALSELLRGERNIETLQEHNPDDGRTLLYRDSAGSIDVVELRNPPLGAEVDTLASVVAAAEFYRDDVGGFPCTFWCGHERIVVVVNDDGVDGHRANVITMPIQPSPLFRTLKLADGGKAFKQRELLRFVSVTCAGAGLAPLEFQPLVRSLRFDFSDTQTGEHTGAGNDRMGREIRSEVAGADRLPDRVVFTFHPYPDLDDELPELEVSIEFAVDADGLDKTITLIPIPGSHRRAVVDATRALMGRLRAELDDNAVVLMGRP